METQHTETLLIAESGGHWGSWFEALQRSGRSTVVLVQNPDESPNAFASRVRERVEHLAHRGGVGRATLVGGGDFSTDVLSARASILRSVVSRMQTGSLTLDAGTRFGKGRHAMAAIASVLEEQLGGRVDVSTTTGAPAAAYDRAA